MREASALLDSPQITAMFDKVRTAVAPEPPPESLRSGSPRSGRGSRFATLGLALLAVVTWWCYSGCRSPWMRLTVPGGAGAGNVIAGQTSVYNGDFFHNESLVALEQLDLLKGTGERLAAKSAIDDPHVGYAVFANLFTVAFSAPYALWALNLLVFGLCAWLAARLSDTLFGDRTKSQLAAALFVLSIAGTAHVGDLSPRLLAIGLSYLWTLLLVRVELAGKPFTGRTLCGLSAMLGAWSLVSTTCTFGLVTLAVVLFRRRHFLAVVLPALTWYAVPQLQHVVLTHFGLTGPFGSDAQLAWQAIETHWLHLAANPSGYGCFLAVELGNFLWNDNPLNLLIGLAGLIGLRHRAKWLLCVCWLAPTAAGLLLLPTSTARGCWVAGNTIVLFAIVSHFAVEAGRRLGRVLGPQAVPVLLGVLLAVQAVWSHSILVGWLYPVGSYATGVFENAGLLRPADLVRMTGPLDDKPTVAGGDVPACVSYGLLDGFGRQAVLPAKRLAPYADRWSGSQALWTTLALQSPLFGCVLIAALGLMRLRWSLLSTLLLTASVAAAQLFGAAGGLDRHVLRPFDDRIAVKPDEKLVAHVQLSGEFREVLERAARDNRQVEFALRLRAVNRATAKPAEIQVGEWASDDSRFAVDASAFLESLAAHRGRVELAICPKAGSRGVLVHSWQALGNPDGEIAVGPSAGDRGATIVRPDGSTETLEWFPSFEIRVVRGDNAYPFKNVLAPFESARPTGYALIGF